MVPIRVIVEAMGGTVIWGGDEPDGDGTRVTFIYKDIVLVTWRDTHYMTVNGVRRDVDVPPQLVSNVTYVPVRFAGEYLGCPVTWLDDTGEVVIVFFTEGRPDIPTTPPI
jgi:hypothetical protein